MMVMSKCNTPSPPTHVNPNPILSKSFSGKECGEECDNNRIYVSGLPTTITEDALVEKFSTIGIIARIRQVCAFVCLSICVCA